MSQLRLPNAAHESRPWRIREIVPDFTLLDVWALPVQGHAEDFEALLELGMAFDPTKSDSAATRLLWQVRDLLGRWFGLGRVLAPTEAGPDEVPDKLPIPGTDETSLIGRLPHDLRATAADLRSDALPFVPLYRTEVEFAAEISNPTVHGVLHLGWVDEGEGRYRGEMAVYVKPRGRVGRGYLAFIAPFRYWIVYPAAMRQIERAWDRRVTH